jgi:hypothetical protein
MQLFSNRNKPPAARLTYELSHKVRQRVLFTLRDFFGSAGFQFEVRDFLDEVAPTLLQQYGGLCRSGPFLNEHQVHPVRIHFMCCEDELALDFLELIFKSRHYKARNYGVDRINAILREEAVGYELTPWTESIGEPVKLPAPRKTGARYLNIEYPRVVELDDLHQHESIVRPCLQLLTDRRFHTANAEMLKAHEEYRRGHLPDAITVCGAAFESVLKTICALKNWPFDPDKDTCSDLVKICKDQGLFAPFYAPIFLATGTVRNKLGDAHGRGPKPLYQVDREHVQHLLQMTSAHIVLLVGLAKL